MKAIVTELLSRRDGRGIPNPLPHTGDLAVLDGVARMFDGKCWQTLEPLHNTRLIHVTAGGFLLEGHCAPTSGRTWRQQWWCRPVAEEGGAS